MKTESLVIHKAKAEDALEIINFLNAVGGESDYLTYGLNDFFISIEEEEIIINECLDLNTSLMLVGKIDNKIVSHLFIDVSPRERLAHIGHLGLSVSKDYWGKSIGSKMLTEAIDWAKEKKLSKLQLQVRTDNKSAICLYEKFNFLPEGTITESLKIGAISFDEFLMGLKLF